MKRGNTEAKTLELNGWGVGDILEGDEGYGADRILITAVGEESFLCKWDYKAKGVYGEESGSTTLTCREWKRVGEEKLKVQKNSVYGKFGTTAEGATVNTPAKELEILQRKYAEICEDNRRKDEEIAELKAKRFTWFNGDECWIYQGDGEDNLHSIVCPVVIDPTELMHIIELAEQYKGLCD